MRLCGPCIAAGKRSAARYLIAARLPCTDCEVNTEYQEAYADSIAPNGTVNTPCCPAHLRTAMGGLQRCDHGVAIVFSEPVELPDVARNPHREKES